MRPPGKITLKPKGFAAFAAVQGNQKPPINRGIEQDANGQWYGWQRQPGYRTTPYSTRQAAKEALLRDAPSERK